MQKLVILTILCFFPTTVYSYTYPSAYDFFISRQYEKESNPPRYIKPDYFRDDYKRDLPDLEDLESLDNGSARKFFEKYPVEVHFTSSFSYAINENTFNMRDVFFTVGQTYHNNYLAITGFITAYGYFDTHDPASDYGYIKGNAGLYDGGVQAIFFDRILVSARGRATFDISTNTFMLMNHFYDTTLDLSATAPFFTDIRDYHLPQNLNGPGIRVGFIGKHYELAYSQGDFMHGIPKSLLAKVNLPNIELRALYGHENRSAPASWSNDISSNLFQFSSTYRFPFLNEKLWVNAIAEYTYRENDERWVSLDSYSGIGNTRINSDGNLEEFAPDAHYIRLEQAIEYYMLNIALREIVQFRDGKTTFNLEYAIYGKFTIDRAEFMLGFQGSTDNRYYIMGGIKF